MYKLFGSQYFIWALILILARLIWMVRDQKACIKKLTRYLHDGDEDLRLKQAAARYMHHCLFAEVAKHHPAGLKRHQGGMQCIVDLPTGQISSWFAHDKKDPGLTEEDLATIDFEVEYSIARLYQGLPEYSGRHDGHTVSMMAKRLGGTLEDEDKSNPIFDIPLRA